MIKDLRLKIDRLKWERDEIKSEQKALIKSILEKEDAVKSLELIFLRCQLMQVEQVILKVV